MKDKKEILKQMSENENNMTDIYLWNSFHRSNSIWTHRSHRYCIVQYLLNEIYRYIATCGAYSKVSKDRCNIHSVTTFMSDCLVK